MDSLRSFASGAKTMFIKNARWQPKDCLRVRAILLPVASLCLLSQAVSATDVNVNCNMQPTGISLALDSLDVVGPHRILVSGDCFDSVHISQRDRLTIVADPPLSASISPPNDANPFAVVVDSGRNILLQGLEITNKSFISNANGIWITNNSDVVFQDGKIEKSASDGIRVSEDSLVSITGTTIQFNEGHGLVIENGSTARLGDGGPVSIKNNVGSGIFLSAATLRSAGLLSVDSNGFGLFLRLGSRARIDSETGPNTFNSNAFHGALILTGSAIEFLGRNTFANNGRNGVLVLEGGTARFRGFDDPEGGGPFVTIIEGNARFGVALILDSGARFIGPHQIRNNGNPSFGGGVLASNNSSFVAQNGTDISNNTGIGVLTEIDASTSFAGATITNNSEEGILLRRIAVGEFFGPNTIFGNGTADLACDETSLAFGNFEGIVVDTCKLVEKVKKAK